MSAPGRCLCGYRLPHMRIDITAGERLAAYVRNAGTPINVLVVLICPDCEREWRQTAEVIE